ncbi:MAG: AraC family transcriptional regulator [Lachnospiraceae bacterium]|nr:AraC family transcriptional regulator [Lachnospiraceae bacterium]
MEHTGIHYQKTGYLKTSFRLFHLTDDKRDTFAYHYHDFEKVLIFLRGDVTYHVEGRSYPLEPYDIVLIRAGEVHRPVIEKKTVYERIILYVSSDFLSSFAGEGADLSWCFQNAQKEQSHVLRLPAFTKNELCQTIKKIEQNGENSDFAKNLYQKTLFLEFMIQLNRAAADQTVQYMEMSGANEKIVAVVDYINEHLTEDLTIDSLSAYFYLSRYYLMHQFKKETGYTIGNYISTKRLLKARNLIRDGSPVTRACYECGFKNYSTFSRAYKKQFGKSAVR